MNHPLGRRYQIVDPLFEPVDMSIDEELCRELAELYFDLLNTFELRRTQWLIQSGQLFELYHGCTHTRRAHAIGCWCIGWYALEDIRVHVKYINGKDHYIRLKEWLKEKGWLKEFMASLLLHDIGHSPFSHALEFNPHPDIRLNHEEVTWSLITGEADSKGIKWGSWIKICLIKLRMDKYDPANFIRVWQQKKGEVNTVREVLKKHGIDPRRVGAIIRGIPIDGANYGVIHILHQLVNSEIDIDRIDHFLRDSYYSGIRFAEYRIRPFLQNLEIVPDSTPKHKEICNKIGKHEPGYIVIRKEGIEYVEYLGTVREFMHTKAFWLHKNLCLIGVLNQAVRVMVQIDPIIRGVLPALTDLTLLQFLKSPFYRGTTVEGYGRILCGELAIDDFVGYSWNLKKRLERSQISKEVDNLYEKAEQINEMDPLHPKVLLFSNFVEIPKDEKGWSSILVDGEYRPLSELHRDLFTWIKEGEKRRTDNILFWTAPGIDPSKVISLDNEDVEKLD